MHELYKSSITSKARGCLLSSPIHIPFLKKKVFFLEMYVEKWLNAPSSYEDTQQLCALLDFLDQELENYHEIFNDVCSTFVL